MFKNFIVEGRVTIKGIAQIFKHWKPISMRLNGEKRKLIITKVNDAYGNVGTILISIEGTPPKGYAIYNPDMETLTLFNYDLSKKKVFKEIHLEVTDDEEIYV